MPTVKINQWICCDLRDIIFAVSSLFCCSCIYKLSQCARYSNLRHPIALLHIITAVHSVYKARVVLLYIVVWIRGNLARALNFAVRIHWMYGGILWLHTGYWTITSTSNTICSQTTQFSPDSSPKSTLSGYLSLWQSILLYVQYNKIVSAVVPIVVRSDSGYYIW